MIKGNNSKNKKVATFTNCLGLMLLALFLPLLSACEQFGVNDTPTPLPSFTPSFTTTHTQTYTYTPTASVTNTPTITQTFTPTLTFTPSNSPTITNTPTITDTPTITPSPTYSPPEGIVKVGQANCRYGPGTAYLYSFGLYQGDHVQVDGRNDTGTWLWVKPDNLERHCWAAASVFNISGDIKRTKVIVALLPKTTFTGPPRNIRASRNENQVTISWEPDVQLSEDKFRGYLLEVYVCQNGAYFWMALQTNATSITIQDDRNCGPASSGKIYTAEKHGYSDPVNIPWP